MYYLWWDNFECLDIKVVWLLCGVWLFHHLPVSLSLLDFLTPFSPSVSLSLSLHTYLLMFTWWEHLEPKTDGSLYQHQKNTAHLLSAPSLSGLFFSAECFFFWTFSSSVSFFPPLCHFNKIHHQRSSLFMSMSPWKCFRISFKLVSGDRILFKFCDGDEWWISKKKKP